MFRPVALVALLTVLSLSALQVQAQKNSGQPFNEIWEALRALQGQVNTLQTSLNTINGQIAVVQQQLADLSDGGEVEFCDGVDNNGNNEIDEGFNLNTNPLHCGACNNACATSESCVSGACITNVISSCTEDEKLANRELEDASCLFNFIGNDCTIGLSESCLTAIDVLAQCSLQNLNQCGVGANVDCLRSVCNEPFFAVFGAEEVCNTIDDDRDGTVDEGDLCPVSQACVSGICATIGG